VFSALAILSKDEDLKGTFDSPSLFAPGPIGSVAIANDFGTLYFLWRTAPLSIEAKLSRIILAANQNRKPRV